jgi:hypothetical protein
MPKTVQQGFEALLAKLPPTASQVAASSKHRDSVESALKASSMTLQRFFQTGSFSNGTGVRYYSDVDYFASLRSQPGSSDTALANVRSVLSARFPRTPVKVRRPAVVVEFGQDGSEKYEVVPAYLQSGEGTRRVYEIPGRRSGWIKAAPDAHVAYVRAIDKKHSGGAKALARLIKAWKYYRDVPVSSFYLEMRATSYANGEKYIEYSYDVAAVLRQLQSVALAAMNDPEGLVGRITACSSDSDLSEALSKLDRAVTRATKARQAEKDGNIREAFEWWDKVFNGEFPGYY